MTPPDPHCLGCGKVHPGVRIVALHDGTLASTYSEAWRKECEARAVLALPSTQRRREYLFGALDRWGKPHGGVEQRRGKAAADELAALVKRMFYDSRNTAA